MATTIAANGQTTFTGDVGEPLGALPSVIVTDANGYPVSGVSVTFAAGANSGTLGGTTQLTGSNGIATLGGWTLGATPGTNTVTANASWLGWQPGDIHRSHAQCVANVQRRRAIAGDYGDRSVYTVH